MSCAFEGYDSTTWAPPRYADAGWTLKKSIFYLLIVSPFLVRMGLDSAMVCADHMD